MTTATSQGKFYGGHGREIRSKILGERNYIHSSNNILRVKVELTYLRRGYFHRLLLRLMKMMREQFVNTGLQLEAFDEGDATTPLWTYGSALKMELQVVGSLKMKIFKKVLLKRKHEET
ncbi:uncharacterized protein LOC131603544 isoform X2 [Vicia villosa]|uniref:uncharacterized protein LOC131603544 isoform X2 n=1 Tax=Vicia villosa TaxID=3911 RepID=UPI00273BF5B8|nr:uncharacterized protein LOC131603544 isoform X2 [Vicia villosa]